MNEIILSELWLGHNKIQNFEGLDVIKSIDEIYASHNYELNSFEGLSPSIRPRNFMVRFCRLKNLIGSPRWVRNLDVEGNDLLETLEGHPDYIETIDISSTRIPGFSDAELMKAMPTLKQIVN